VGLHVETDYALQRIVGAVQALDAAAYMDDEEDDGMGGAGGAGGSDSEM
jgi:hypothetical protein